MAEGFGAGGGPQLPTYMRKKSAPSKAAASSARNQSRGTASRSRAGRSGVPRNTAPKAGTKRPSGAATTAKRATNAQSAKARSSAGQNSTRNAPRSRKKRSKQNSGAIKLMIAAAVVVVLAIIGVSMISDAGGEAVADMEKLMDTAKRFKDGVKLVGVDVSGMTPEEALGLVKNAAEKTLKTVAITVNAGEYSWTLNAEALGMDYDLAQTMANGINFGRREDDAVEITQKGAGEYDAQYIWDRAKLETILREMAKGVDTGTTAAYAEPVTDWEQAERFNFIPGTQGQTLNVAASADAVEALLKNKEFEGVVDAVINAVLPEDDMEELRQNTQLIASYTTKFSARKDDEIKQNRKFNIQKAADIINGYAVEPGQEWSFNTVVGPRTFELGWKGANGISGGKEYTIQAGGGICQVSTTLYNALLGANMQIIDRRAHSIPSDYVPKGLDATVDTRGIDFVWKNNSPSTAYIFARVEKVEGSSSRNTITVYIYGRPLPEGITYQSRSEIISETPRTDTVYTNTNSIPVGYQQEKVVTHNAFEAEAYLDKLENGKVVESTLLYKDKYAGNPAEILVGTGAYIEGMTIDPTWQPYGTAPTPAS